MSEKRIDSLDEQGRKLSAAFAEAEASALTRRRAWRVAVPVVAAAACAFGLFVGLGSDKDGGSLTLSQAVAEVSKAAFDQPGVSPESPLYMKSRQGQTVFETWGDGEQNTLMRFTPGWFGVDPGDCPKSYVEEKETKRPAFAKTYLNLKPGTEFTWEAADLYRAIRDQASGRYMMLPTSSTVSSRKDVTVWFTVMSALIDGAPTLTADQRSALVGVMAEIPDVRTLGRVKDPAGRQSIGFVNDPGDGEMRIFFDADTGIVTWRDQVVGGKRLPAYELLDYRRVDAMPDLEVTDPDITRECMARIGNHFVRSSGK